VFEAVTVIAGFDYMTVMGKPVEQYRCEFFIPKDIRLFCEAQVSGDNDAGFLIQLTDEVEQQCAIINIIFTTFPNRYLYRFI